MIRPLPSLLLAWVLTSLWPIIGKAGTERFDPILFIQAGTALGLLALAPWLGRRRWEMILSRELRFSFFMMGFFATGMSSFIFITALRYTSPSNAAIMAQVEVLYSALLCAWLLKERITPAQGLASLMVLLGTGCIMVQDLTSLRWKGDLMILLSPWMFQVSHIYAKRLPADIDAVTITAGRLFYGVLTLVPLSLWALSRGPRWSWEPAALGILAAQALGQNCLNHLFWYGAIRRLELAKATAIILSYPALTVIFSWLLGRDSLGIVQLLGLGLTLGGAYWISWLTREKQLVQ
ncbi:MAG: DMT family transporter [Elusimicrobia bacterium]|nr:DMT family transporter [Elusimicrobiota bacterium]